MNKKLDFSNSQKFNLHFTSHEEAKTNHDKGWSFSNVYHLTELRDVFLVYREFKPENYKAFLKKCVELNINPAKKKWTERRILEIINALKNFGVINYETNEIIYDFNFESTFNQPLLDSDKVFFKRIYFSYFRFVEIMKWFIDFANIQNENGFEPVSESLLINNSKVLFSISGDNRFNDTFFKELCNGTDLYLINSKNDKSAEAMKRFWDVFIKWGRQLNLLQKFNLDFFNFKTIEGKSISCVYFIDNTQHDFNLKDFIKTHFTKKYIYIPELVLLLSLENRWSVDFSKQFILDEYQKDKFSYSIDRTSEIFIKQSKISEDDLIFHPFHKNSYVSNLIIL